LTRRADTPEAEVADATRRTRLANERTELAWWRTGLTALAVALGVGRVVPELNDTVVRWPYLIAGVGFAVWGILAIAYGSRRGARVDRVLDSGRFPDPEGWMRSTLALGGIALGALTAILILLD
jgi:inner membrane protein YidH